MRTHIMNAQGVDLENILSSFCKELDNFCQVASDAGDEEISTGFSKDYILIESFLTKVRNNEELEINERNSIRSTMKHNLKQAGIYYC